MMHEHTWKLFSVVSQRKRIVTPRGVVSDDDQTQAKLHYRCDVCGEVKEELYEGSSGGVPDLDVSAGIGALPGHIADSERTIRL